MLKSDKILIVDDCEIMREIMLIILEKEGYKNIIEAENGLEAYNILNKEKIGLIFSDWSMPLMSGYELIKKIKSNKKLKNIPFVMVSAQDCYKGKKKVLDLGAEEYLLKPFNIDNVSKIISKIKEKTYL